MIMWVSILRGRPFVFEIVQAQMPPPVWKRLSSRKWFIDILTEAAYFWVYILVAMTAIVTIQPLLVTFLFVERNISLGEVNGTMRELSNILMGGQFVILFYGIYKSAKEGGQRDRNKKRVKEVQNSGLDQKMLRLHRPPISITVSNTGAKSNHTNAFSHHI